MKPYTIKEVAQALGWKPSRIEKMISRAYFVPEHVAAGGRRGRSWSFLDVVKLRVLDQFPTHLIASERRELLERVPFDNMAGRFLMIETVIRPRASDRYVNMAGETIDLPPAEKRSASVRVVEL